MTTPGTPYHLEHRDAHEWCFIANSVNFPVRVDPTIAVAGQQI